MRGATPASTEVRGEPDELSVVTELDRLVFSTTGTATATVVVALSVTGAADAAEEGMTTCKAGESVRN